MKALSALLASLCLATGLVQPALAAEKVRVSLFSWPGYGFWFIAKEKNLVPEVDLDIQIIEDPYQSFSAMAAGQLDVTSSTVEYGPIAAEQGVPVKFVTYTNPSIGTDKIILAPDIASPADLKGKKVAVLEGGLTQIYMGIWLEENGVKFDEVTYVNVIMDDAVGAMVSGEVAAGEFWEPFGSKVLENLKGSRVLTSSAEDYWKSTALLGDGMYMTDSLIKDRPAAAEAAMRAYFAAVAWWKAHPAEGNEIIAKALQFPVSDVELVIGKDGKPNPIGIWVFDLDEAARFMKVKDGPVPIGSAEGVNDHWALTNTWWLKFGLMKKALPPEAGIDLTPLKAAVANPPGGRVSAAGARAGLRLVEGGVERERSPGAVSDPSTPFLSVEEVGKDYPLRGAGSLRALDGVSFEVHPHEVCVMLGPSGCGKSTLLRMVAGLDAPSQGGCRIQGARIVGPGRDRGMVFQSYTSFPWLTVRQNVEYGLKLNGETIALAEGAGEYFLDRVGLSQFADQYPNQLSGGMRQRVALARALAIYPRMLLMDEPFGALDAETRWQMQELLLEVVTRERMTVLMVTHDIDEALFLGDVIVFLSRNPGRVREIMRPEFKRDGRPATKEAMYDAPGHRDLERHVMQLMRDEGKRT